MCFSLKGWENVCFELGSEQLRLKSPSPTGEHMYTYFELSFELRVEVCVEGGSGGEKVVVVGLYYLGGLAVSGWMHSVL